MQDTLDILVPVTQRGIITLILQIGKPKLNEDNTLSFYNSQVSDWGFIFRFI